MSSGGLFNYLPWWGTHTSQTENGPLPFLVLVDGTCVVGIKVQGKDFHGSDNEQLNSSSDIVRDIVNRLPPNAFLQSVWDMTSADYADVIDAYEAKAHSEADELLKEQRTRRAQMFRADKNLARGSLTYWVGLQKALRTSSEKNKGFLTRFFGNKTPKVIERADLESIGAALGALSEQVCAVLLANGYEASRLDELALITECYQSCNPESHSRLIPPKIADSCGDLTEELLQDQWAFLRPFTLREQIPNGPMTWNEDCFAIDDPPVLSRVLGMQRAPSTTVPNMLRSIQDGLNARCKVVITHVAQDDEKIRARLKRQRDRMEAQSSGNRRDISAEVSQREHDVLLEKLLTEDERVFATSVYVVIHAKNKASLDRISEEAMQLFANLEIGLATQYEQQLPAWIATLPANGYRAPKQFRMLSRNAADFTLLHEPAIGDQSADLLYHNRRNGIRKLSIGEGKPDKHALIFGGTGSGKSFHVSTIIQSALSQKQSVTIVDVQGPEISSYRRMTELFGGKYYALSAGDVEVSLNPFPSHEQMFVGDEIDEDQLSFLKNLIVLMASPEFLSSRESTFYTSVAQSVIQQAYIATEGTGHSPMVSDIVACLKDYRDPQDDGLDQYAKQLHLHLREWINDRKRSRLLNRKEAFQMNASFSVFDFYGLKEDPHLATVLLLVCANLIWNQLKHLDRSENKLIVFDEAWALVQNEAGANLLQSLYRTARKFNGSVFAISQSATDILNTPVKDAIVNNTSTFFLQKHNHGFEAAVQICSLNHRQEELLRGLEYRRGEYADCLMVDKVKGDAAVLRLAPTPFDLWLNTTNPNDMAFREQLQQEKGLSLLETIRVLAEQFPQGAPDAKTN